ncbi:transposase [Rhodospirillum sp. A1_3_36]|uniref:transposase n=1 Tax=Rhodospirillum sp. A1_3_36 TaxID=3391666 RepID=UPI0039A6AC41
MWSVLEHGGSSDAADREFEGQEWMGFLLARCIPFAIRLRENRIVQLPCGKQVQLGSFFRRPRSPRTIRARLPERQGHPALDLHFSAKRIRGSKGIIIIASTEPGLGPLKLYRKRWAIECLFGDTKTRGLNLEDTRLTISSRLSLLMAIVTLAIAWACRTASDIMVRAAPP